MVTSWSWLVADVEAGYGEQIDEYTNDLYCRDWLHEAWPLLDQQVTRRWDGRIEGLDDRFRGS